MAAKGKSGANAEKSASNSFELQVKQALENFADAEWLGANSPLAAPYILGQRLDPLPTGETAKGRGLALQNALRTAVMQISDPLLQQVLLHGFLERKPRRNLESVAVDLALAPRTFFRHVAKALEELADSLSRTLLPTLRLEAPFAKALIGREQLLQNGREALRAHQSISLIGPSGVGKTTLAAAIAHQWANADAHPAPVFLFTLRTGLNDQFASFVFALSYFLRLHGAANTWRQLVADKGVIQPERVLGLLRHDLAQPRATPLLLCVDEVATLQVELPDHAQIIHLLEELRTQAPLLLIGEQMVIKTDQVYHLAGLTLAETQLLLQQKGIPAVAPETLQQLFTVTHGNPALLTLAIAMRQQGDEWDDLLYDLSRAPGLAALFTRIWRRLQEAERNLLWQLAVFREPAPQDAWQAEQTRLAQLQQRELVVLDDQGGVRLPPHIHHLVYERIPTERRPALHLQAAHIREARGEYVAAMHHHCQGDQPALAVWLWYSRRTAEIARGQGARALVVLDQINAVDLPDGRDRAVLQEARSELRQLAGHIDAAQAELQRITPGDAAGSPMLHAQVLQRQAELYESQGQIEQALAGYRTALDTLLGMHQQREVTLHTKLSFLQMYRLHNAEQANREALLARIKAEAFHGQVAEMRGDYGLARTLYESALMLAETANFGATGVDLATLSRVYTYLSVLTLKQGEVDRAIDLIEKAMDCDRRRGDVISPLYDLMNLASAYREAGRTTEAYQEALNGLHLAERLKHSYLIAGLAATVGEACCDLGRFTEAEQYAMQSLQQEEEYFRSSALVILGLVRQASGQTATAVKLLHEAIVSAQNLDDKYSEAYGWRILGQVYQADQQPLPMGEAYQTAALLYTQLGLPQEVAAIERRLAGIPTVS
ncbi:MAG: hypothetical protein R3E79_41675 [Caldilineaceae bacterium]